MAVVVALEIRGDKVTRYGDGRWHDGGDRKVMVLRG